MLIRNTHIRNIKILQNILNPLLLTRLLSNFGWQFKQNLTNFESLLTEILYFSVNFVNISYHSFSKF